MTNSSIYKARRPGHKVGESVSVETNPGLSHLSIGSIYLITDEDFCAGTLPASCACSAQHVAACRVDVETGDDACTGRTGNDEEGNAGVLQGRFTKIVKAHDIVGGTGHCQYRLIRGNGEGLYQTRWRPFIMGLTALTAPLPPGNLSVL